MTERAQLAALQRAREAEAEVAENEAQALAALVDGLRPPMAVQHLIDFVGLEEREAKAAVEAVVKRTPQRTLERMRLQEVYRRALAAGSLPSAYNAAHRLTMLAGQEEDLSAFAGIKELKTKAQVNEMLERVALALVDEDENKRLATHRGMALNAALGAMLKSGKLLDGEEEDGAEAPDFDALSPEEAAALTLGETIGRR